MRGPQPPGTGLANLRERLRGVFGAGARLELQAIEPHGLRAELALHGGRDHDALTAR